MSVFEFVFDFVFDVLVLACVCVCIWFVVGLVCVCACLSVFVWLCLIVFVCLCVVFGLFFVFRFVFACVVCCAWVEFLRSLLSSTGTWSVVDDNDLKKSRHAQTRSTSKKTRDSPNILQEHDAPNRNGEQYFSEVRILCKNILFRSAN